MHWYIYAQQMKFDFDAPNIFQNLSDVGFVFLNENTLSLKVGRRVIKGSPDSLVAKLNWIIQQIQEDGDFVRGLVQSIINIDLELRNRGNMVLTKNEKNIYRNSVLALIQGLENSNISDKHKIVITERIRDIADTFLINPTWIMMKLQTLNKNLTKFLYKINAQIIKLSEKRDLLVSGIQYGFLVGHNVKDLAKRTEGYAIKPLSKDMFEITKPDGQKYFINNKNRSCTCPAGKTGTPCKHLALIDEYLRGGL